MSEAKLPPLPSSWSELTWQQLTAVWTAKMRYGGNADVARAAVMLAMTAGDGCRVHVSGVSERTGETVYTIEPEDGPAWSATAREIAHAASRSLPWLDYPYGDPGEPAEKDEKGKVVKEARDPVRGYVSGMRDAMILPENEVTVARRRFSLPQVACNNLTWQQYRSLQAVAPGLFREGVGQDEAADLQAQFMAHMLVPRTLALMDSSGKTIKLRPHYVYEYDSERAGQMVAWWRRRLAAGTEAQALFHICFQCYQTAVGYYAQVFPLLFGGGGKEDPLHDALTGEVNTLNSVMKYQGYTDSQQVYDENLPIILGVLNNMTREAKEIEKMNSKIKRK